MPILLENSYDYIISQKIDPSANNEHQTEPLLIRTLVHKKWKKNEKLNQKNFHHTLCENLAQYFQDNLSSRNVQFTPHRISTKSPMIASSEDNTFSYTASTQIQQSHKPLEFYNLAFETLPHSQDE